MTVTWGASTPSRAQRTAERGKGSRGQTLQDYTVGIGLFVLTVAGVLAAMFGFLDPLSAGAASEDISQSQRISESIVNNHSTADAPTQLDADRLFATLNRSPDQLESRWGVENSTNLNVSVEPLDGEGVATYGGAKLAVGSSYEAQSTSSAARVVTFDASVCDPSCRLVVRVW